MKYEQIQITTRDTNGKRSIVDCNGRHAAMKYAQTLTDEDEILIVSQDGMCLYSALQSDNALTADDLTGFFA